MKRRGKFTAVVVLVSFSLLAMFVRAGGWGGPGFDWSALHIFLFNLTAGGFLVLLAGDESPKYGFLPWVYLVFAFGSSAAAAFNQPGLIVAFALLAGAAAEAVRESRFSFFPWDFFRPAALERKFEQAALLCLSLGLFICAGSIVNNHWLRLVRLERLDLHVFFLGFSFPLSLMGYAEVFRLAGPLETRFKKLASEFCFWGLNLGVILFFVFILAGNYPAQFVMALLLFVTIIVLGFVHVQGRADSGSRDLFLSALLFLVVGSFTGIAYLLTAWKLTRIYSPYLLSLHSAANLFGWNLSWMCFAAAGGRTPSRLRAALFLHWAFVLSVPLGREAPLFSLVSLVLCLSLFWTWFPAVKEEGDKHGPVEGATPGC